MTKKTAGVYIDEIYTLKNVDLKEANAKVASLKKLLGTKIDDMESKFKKSELNGMIGKIGKLKIEPVDKIVMDDYDIFNAWVIKNKAIDCYQKKLSEKAILDRMVDKKGRPTNKLPPGLKFFKTIKYSITKA